MLNINRSNIFGKFVLIVCAVQIRLYVKTFVIQVDSKICLITYQFQKNFISTETKAVTNYNYTDIMTILQQKFYNLLDCL